MHEVEDREREDRPEARDPEDARAAPYAGEAAEAQRGPEVQEVQHTEAGAEPPEGEHSQAAAEASDLRGLGQVRIFSECFYIKRRKDVLAFRPL